MEIELKYKKKFDLVTSGLLKSSPATVTYLNHSYDSNTGTFKGMAGIHKDCNLTLTYLWKGVQTKTEEFSLKLKKYILTITGVTQIYIGETAMIKCSGGEAGTESEWTVTNGRIVTDRTTFDNNGESTIVIDPTTNNGNIVCTCKGCGVSVTHNILIMDWSYIKSVYKPYIRGTCTYTSNYALYYGGASGVSPSGVHNLPPGCTSELKWVTCYATAGFFTGCQIHLKADYVIKHGNNIIAQGTVSGDGSTTFTTSLYVPPVAIFAVALNVYL